MTDTKIKWPGQVELTMQRGSVVRIRVNGEVLALLKVVYVAEPPNARFVHKASTAHLLIAVPDDKPTVQAISARDCTPRRYTLLAEVATRTRMEKAARLKAQSTINQYI